MSGAHEDGGAGPDRRRASVPSSLLFDRLPHGLLAGTPGSPPHAVNDPLRQMLGCPPGTPPARVDPFAADRFVDQHARDAFLHELRTHGRVVDHLLRLRRDDGSTLWVEVTATPDGALVRDVSDRRRHEDRLRDLQTELLQAEKLAALGQTISGVAHELNNPLATILAWAERLAESPADDRTRRGLDVILKESERAARIVRNLLAFARKRQSTRTMVDLNEVVRETLALRAYGQRVSNIDVAADLQDGLPQIFADAHQIKQVLLNLVINAEQAMKAHGGGRLAVRTRRDGDRVVLEVEDNGPGIPEDLHGRIFDPFFTTKSVGEGTGLGLSVAFALVQEHGGRLGVRSRPGEGATFVVDLPAARQPLPRAAPAQLQVSADTFRGRRALVVEDEAALGAAVGEALADVGFAVDRAWDGEEGLTRVSEAAYDLIVCDLKMPRLDGMQFYRAMAAAAPALARRVIFVTGDVAGTDAERFLEETGCRWLAKPFRLGDLLRAARDALA